MQTPIYIFISFMIFFIIPISIFLYVYSKMLDHMVLDREDLWEKKWEKK
jgi:hypothetical protein